MDDQSYPLDDHSIEDHSIEGQSYTLEDHLDELLDMVKEKKYRQLKSILVEWNEADIAEFLEEAADSEGVEKAVVIYRTLPKEQATEVFSFLSPDTQGSIISIMTDAEVGNILEELYVDDAVDMLEELPATVVRRVLANATPETRAVINQFLKYPENSAGSIMTNEYLAVKKTMDVGGTFDYIRAHGQDMETIYTLFVVDDRRKLLGVVTVKDLLMNSYTTRIEDIMDDNVISCVTTDDQEDVADLFNKYDLMTIAVVDTEGRMVGIVTVDDAVDVMEEEATEDMEKMAAIMPTDKPYLKTGVFETWKSRIIWLLLLMVTATFTGQIITSYQNSLLSCITLAAFIPMLMDTSGNSGSQSSVSIIRALSLGDVDFSDFLQVIWKEFRVALLTGLSLAVVNFAKIMLIDGMLFHNSGVTVTLALAVCVALIITIVIAKLVGCILPMVTDKLGIDPAFMASPFITTIVDALALLVYFGVANRMLL